MRGRFVWAPVTLVAGSLFALSLAGESAPRALTIDQALRVGLDRNPGLTAVRADTRAARADELLADRARWPRLLVDAGWRRTDNQVLVFGDKLTAAGFTAADFALDRLNHPDPADHLTTGVDLELPVFTSGRIRAGAGAAREEAGAALARQRAAESDLVVRVTEAYFAVPLARAAVGVAESALSSARAHERAAAARVEAGSALQSDLLRAQVRRLERERELERRRADLDLALARLRVVLGLAAGEAVEPVTRLEMPSEPLGDLRVWLERASPSRPEVEAARRTASAAKAMARTTRAALGPEVSGLARYERNASGLDASEGSFLLGVRVRWAALDRGRSARIEAAQARSEAADAWQRAAQDNASLEVEQAYREAVVADRTVSVYREAAAAASEAQRISSERYAAGLLPLTDLLEVEAAKVGAQLAEIAALYDAVLGRVRLARATGTLEVAR